MAEPLSIAVWAGDLAEAAPGNSVGILGSGPIGMSVLLYCRHLGLHKIYVTDKLDYRLKMAESAGAVWTGNPDREDIVREILRHEPGELDLIFDCCGMQEAMDQAIKIIKPGGRIMIVGIPEFDNWIIPADRARRKEIGFQNVRRQNDRMQKAIDLIARGEIDAGGLITHRFPFPRTAEAFDMVSAYRDGVMKAMVELKENT
jgi:L-iditol 2-dehydrogenase